MARTILQQACKNAAVVHIVADTHPEGPNIKDVEHDLREQNALPSCSSYCIGPSQKRPADLKSAWRSPQFKKGLFIFLKDEWMSQVYAPIIAGHQLYFALENECYLYTSDGKVVSRTQVRPLESGHTEADTRVIFHAQFVAQVHDKPPVIVIRSDDTDVFILLVYHCRFISSHLWMDAGVDSKNTRRMIDVSHLANILTSRVCDALPSFHALTGCDYTASFMRKAKWRPFQIMKNSEIFTAAISKLGDTDVIDQDVSAVVEEYLCSVYGARNVSGVNEARLQLFNKLYAPKRTNDPLEKLKTSDPCCMPPCQKVLQQKLRRTNFVAFVWKNAREAKPVAFGPEGHGWEVEKGRMKLLWFSGPSVPANIEIESSDLLSEEDNEEEIDIQESYSSDEEEDPDF